jgi:hypothetical protein
MSDDAVPPSPEGGAGTEASPSTPFIVELPNGQRLEVGDVTPGTIVEIATWRGPGAPDARTERMVIAVTPPPGADQGRQARLLDRRGARIVVAAAATTAAVAGIFLATPVDATVPRGGDTVLGGRADRAIVVSRPVSTLHTGLAVVVVHPRRNVAVLGRVSSVSGDVVLVRAGDEYIQVGIDDIEGDVAVVVPFLGAPMSWWSRGRTDPTGTGLVG